MDISSIKTNFKRFLSNPNTLTFILVLVLIVIVYFIYSYMVSAAVSPVEIPYTTETLSERTEINGETVSTVKISGNFISSSRGNLIQNRGMIYEKYVAPGFIIPKNSFFYKDAITDEETANETDFENIPDDYTIARLEVDFHSTYGCSIMPGNYIDLYFKATDDEGTSIIYELFIKSIQVLKVADAEGLNVFTSTPDDETPQPKWLYFAVPLEYNALLEKAKLITTNDIEIIPVPRNAGYSENPEDTTIANEAVENFILSKSVYIAD